MERFQVQILAGALYGKASWIGQGSGSTPACWEGQGAFKPPTSSRTHEEKVVGEHCFIAIMILVLIAIGMKLSR